MRYIALLSILVIGALCVGFSQFSSEKTVEPVTESEVARVMLGQEEFVLDISDEQTERQQGLSGRERLHPGTGMLFIFPSEGVYGFWMKDMHFAIDMIWLDGDGKIVHIVEEASPESYPETFTPVEEAQYVIEVTAHTTERNNVKVGDFVELGF